MPINLTPTTLTPPPYDVGDGLGSIQYVNGRLFLYSWNDKVFYTDDDGATWVAASAPVDGSTNGFAYTDGRWFAFGADGFHHSVDFATWTHVPKTSCFNKDFTQATVCKLGDWWVLGGQFSGYGYVVVSLDLVTMQQATATAFSTEAVGGVLKVGTKVLAAYYSDVAATTVLDPAAWAGESVGAAGGGNRKLYGPTTDGRVVFVGATPFTGFYFRNSAGVWSVDSPVSTFHASAYPNNVALCGNELTLWDYSTDLLALHDGESWAELHAAIPAGAARAGATASASAYYVALWASDNSTILYKYAASAPVLTGDITSTLSTSTSFGAIKLMQGDVTSTTSLAGSLTLQLLRAADAQSAMHATASMSVTADLLAELFSQVKGVTLLPTDDDAQPGWVVDPETGASTRYEQYGFNAFAVIDGVAYGAKRDGIYRLDGDTDDGAPVQAMVSFGKQNFGTSALKSVASAYLGASSDGNLYLKLIAEGRDYLYKARGFSEDLKLQRVDVGRGVRATYLEFELYNSDGDDFELASVEFAALPLNRRI